ncbi:MAG TPA: hypothetical protein VMM79_13750 [Longimicrobiales bacterium]|nr:hypothetical protein [Longimicrobiales bacterium]
MRIRVRLRSGLLVGSYALFGCADEAGRFDPAAVRFDTLAVVGVAEGNDVETFGDIRAVEPTGDGGFLLLDGQGRSVSWFAEDGTYMGGVTARGEGPGELAFPVDIALTRSRDLVVLDPSNARLSWFALNDSGIDYTNQRRNELGGSQFCALGDRLYLSVPRNDAAVHEIGEGPEPVRSFGTPISTPGLESLGAARWLGESMIPAGPVVCVSEPDLIVTVGRSSPLIRAYTPDGDEVWETELSDFRPIKLQVKQNGGVGAAPSPEDGIHMALSASRWDNDLLLLQYEVRTGTGGPDASEYGLESRFLELATGQEVHRSTELPLIAAASGRYAYEQRNQPVPQVAVLARGRN